MALPQYAYRDPALQVEADELHRMGCKGCARAETMLGLSLCPSDLRYPSCKRNKRDGYLLAREHGGEG